MAERTRPDNLVVQVVWLDRDHFGLSYETGRWMVEWSD